MKKISDNDLHTLGLIPDLLPKHVAIIMDGNGRWAKERNLPRSFGHRKGVERLKEIIRFSSDIGIEALSLYAFSTENWARPIEEINTLCSLFVEFFSKEFDELNENHVIIRALGDTSKFPDKVHNLIMDAENKTALNDGLHLNIAMNYGSRDEIIRAAQLAISEDGQITKETFENHLYTHDIPDVDLLIRTSGEQRLSNFLLYQASYAEMIFTKTYWPDFTQDVYINTIKDYQKRSRRFGGLEKNNEN